MNQAESKNGARLCLSLVFLFALGWLGYGPYLGNLGFYWDDWYKILAGLYYGPEGLIRVFAVDRPGTGYFMALCYRLFGPNPDLWQAAIISYRLAGALGLFWALCIVWPRQRLANTSAAAVYLVYPGFSQQPSCLAYAFHFASLAFAMLSIALSLKAQVVKSRPARLWLTVSAMLLAFWYMFMVEHFFGLEVLRVLFLGFGYLAGNWAGERNRFKAFLAAAAPYLLVTAGFLFWRLVLFKPLRGKADQRAIMKNLVDKDPWSFVYYRGQRLARDFLETSFGAWSYNPGKVFLLGPIPLNAAFMSAGAALTALYLWLRARLGISARDGDGASTAWGLVALGAGAVTAFCTLLPPVFAMRQYFYYGAMDRYCLSALPALALMAAGLVFLLPRAWLRYLVLAGLLAVGLGFQGTVAHSYAERWHYLRNYVNQLAWRAPGLEPNTMVVLDAHGMSRLPTKYTVFGPVNMLYGFVKRKPQAWGIPLDNYTEKLKTHGSLHNQIREIDYLPRRALVKEDALVISMPRPDACLKVLRPGQKLLPRGGDPLLAEALPFSHPGRILDRADPVRIPREVFGPEQEHGWCWYYQSAELARQRKDWAEIARLRGEAKGKGLGPREALEWLPFVEAELRLGHDELARKMAERAQAKLSGRRAELFKEALNGLAVEKKP